MIKGTCHCGAIAIEVPGVPPSNENGRMGVNMANFEPGVVASLEVRRLDGADTWEYL